MFAHSTDVSATVFEYVCASVAMGAVRNALMLSSGICDLGEEALLGAQTEVLVVEEGSGMVGYSQDCLVAELDPGDVTKQGSIRHIDLRTVLVYKVPVTTLF